MVLVVVVLLVVAVRPGLLPDARQDSKVASFISILLFLKNADPVM